MRLVAALVLLASARASAGDCHAELDARHVPYKRTARSGVALAVEITGPIGGVRYAGVEPLVIDCSLAVSLAEAAPYIAGITMTQARVASAYSRRDVRGTHVPSKHSFGLAIDISAFADDAGDVLRVASDYESGLGDEVDCIGEPATRAAEALKRLQCQLVRSGLFHLVLSPDYDDDHRDHFHLEVTPWSARPQLRSPLPAIH
jgi:hypothetical protein